MDSESIKATQTELEHLEMASTTILSEANDRLRVLSLSLQEAGQFERGALVRALHAEIRHTLPLITLRLNELGRQPERPDAPPHAQQVAESFYLLDRALRLLRALASDVRNYNA